MRNKTPETMASSGRPVRARVCVRVCVVKLLCACVCACVHTCMRARVCVCAWQHRYTHAEIDTNTQTRRLTGWYGADVPTANVFVVDPTLYYFTQRERHERKLWGGGVVCVCVCERASVCACVCVRVCAVFP